MAEKAAIEMAEAMSNKFGGRVKTELEVTMNGARTMTHIFEGIKNGGDRPSRLLMNKMLKQVLERNPTFLGVWTCWETNALDGMGNEFSNAEGHDNTGRFISDWYRSKGEISKEPLVDYTVPGAGDYYLLRQTTVKEVMVDPYRYLINGKQVLLTSLVAPFRHGGFVVGIDFELRSFSRMVETIKPFETGYGFLMSNSGQIVAHPDATRLGKSLETSKSNTAVPSAITRFNHTDETDRINGDTVYFIAQSLEDVAQEDGDRTKQLSVKNQDEIGNLAKWFNLF